ncbi:TonB-dependent receptor [Siphonobacter sp. SORGH_AS_0500]|uniref:TonB-dependent receptor n=1 Tax=Siphonobacter sp. SORGH_AS_0500 TaxID=1864824 RepID=UPI002860C1A3|nr:TonB-dependent receptor [Siphonobacter sp. SORGH_AS_0500]MDR6198016.1 iron complex outermembrane receptor protein [Siphonobacter sp. SORGH_AS_0500]
MLPTSTSRLSSKIILSTLAFILSVWLKSYAQQKNGSLEGRVETENQEPLPGISIRLEATTFGVTTDAEGSFQLLNIPTGTYTLTVSGVGYEAHQTQVTVKAGERLPLRYQLNQKTHELSLVTITSQRNRSFSALNKIDVPIRDLPLSVSSVTVKTIEQRGIDDLGDAMKNTTGVRSNNTYGGFQHFTIRGFSNFVLLVDGVRDERHNISTSAPNTNLANVERIEVLKGPASVLFGHSALGGIINIVRKQPTADFRANFSTSYGSFNTRRMRAGAGGSINTQLRYRMDFGVSNTDGFRQAGVATNNAYVALEYTPTSKDYFYLAVGANKDVYRTDSGIPVLAGGALVPGMDITTRYNDPADFLKHTRTDFQLRYVRELTPHLKLSNQLSYSDDNIDYFSTEELSLNSRLDSITRSFPYYFNHLTKPLQNQLELTYDWNTGKISQKVLLGYSLNYLDRKTYNGTIDGPGKFAKIPVVNPIENQGYLNYYDTYYRATIETVHGIYLQDFIRFSEKIKALVGLRYDLFKGDYYTDQVDRERHVTSYGATSTIARNALTYRLGLVYQPIEPLSVYASYSTYFKPSRRVAPNGETFDPETGYQAEVGSRLELSSRFSANASIYYMRKDNQVESLSGGIFKRIGSAESKGVEIEAQGNPVAGLDLTAGYTFTQAQYLPFASAEVNPVAGNAAILAPKHLVNAWINYTIQQTTLKGLNAGAGFNFQSKAFANAANTYQLPAYKTVDAALGYQMSRVDIRANVNNLFNERYFTNVILTRQFYPGATRHYLLTISYQL